MDVQASREVVVPNAQGIHARPSQAIVSVAQGFDATVSLSASGRTADAASILSVMTLGASQGTTVRIEARGAQAEEAAAALAELIAGGFSEVI